MGKDVLVIQALMRANRDGDDAYILEVLSSPFSEPDDLMMAAKYAGDMRIYSSTDQLIRLLRAGRRAVRVQAIKSLTVLDATSAVPQFIEIALDQEEHHVTRSWAIDGLGKLGDRRAVPALIELLDDDDPHNRMVAALSLGRIGDEAALGPMATAKARASWRRRMALRKAMRIIRRAQRRQRQ